MSFILEALKKLEQKKQQGSVPDLMTVHSSMPQQEKKNRSIWPYIILIALLLNAGILTVWLRPWQEKPEEIAALSSEIPEQETTVIDPTVTGQNKHEALVAPLPEAKKETETEADTVNTDTSFKTTDPTTEKQVKESADSATIHEVVNNEKTIQNEDEPTEETITSHRMDISPRDLEDLKKQIKVEQYSPDDLLTQDIDPSENIAAVPSGQVIEFSQLSKSVRDELPAININAHIYSNNPGSRLANINGSIIREGESITSDLTIEEITENGIIFNFEGLLFRMRAF